jgi:hypothetical protein
MDDICDSVDTVEEARKQTDDIDKVLETGGFKVKGWTSNKTLKENDDNDETEMKLFKGDVEEKVLGIEWNNHTDKFSFKIKNDLLELTSTEHSGHNTVNRTRLVRLPGKLERDAKIMLAQKWKSRRMEPALCQERR